MNIQCIFLQIKIIKNHSKEGTSYLPLNDFCIDIHDDGLKKGAETCSIHVKAQLK